MPRPLDATAAVQMVPRPLDATAARHADGPGARTLAGRSARWTRRGTTSPCTKVTMLVSWHREWATNPPEAAPEGSPTVAPSRWGSSLRGGGPNLRPACSRKVVAVKTVLDRGRSCVLLASCVRALSLIALCHVSLASCQTRHHDYETLENSREPVNYWRRRTTATAIEATTLAAAMARATRLACFRRSAATHSLCFSRTTPHSASSSAGASVSSSGSANLSRTIRSHCSPG